MKAFFAFFVLCATFLAVSALPATDDTDVVDQPTYPFYNPYSYQYMMCRLKCRQSCLEQGYWKGVCKQGSCFCFGPMGPYGKYPNGYPVPTF